MGEVAGYGAGFAFTPALVVGQASLWSWSVTRRARPAVLFDDAEAAVITFLHFLLGLETSALLVGTLAMFVALSIITGVKQTVAGAGDLRAPT